MSNLLVSCKIKPLEYNSFQNIDFVAFNYTISLKRNEDNLIIKIESLNNQSNNMKISTLFSGLFDLIYLCLGKFPKIISYLENGQSYNENELLKKYTSSPLFGKTYFSIRYVDIDVLNEQTLTNIINFNKKNYSLCSLEYLTSKTYDEIMWEHKLTLVLHVLDGVCNFLDFNIENLKNEFFLKYQGIPRNSVGGYIAFVDYAFSKYFFNFSVSNTILQALGRKNRLSFLQGTEQFRNF